MRCQIYRLSLTHHLLLLVLHCLVADESSFDELLAELASLYNAFQIGAVPALAENVEQYAEWAQWQREQVEGGFLGPSCPTGPGSCLVRFRPWISPWITPARRFKLLLAHGRLCDWPTTSPPGSGGSVRRQGSTPR